MPGSSIIAMRRFAGVIWVMCVLAWLAGCAAAPQYLYNVDPTANLATYRTFAFFDERGQKMVPYQSVAHRYLKSAVAREMQARGYQPSDRPDLLVNIHLQRKDDENAGTSATQNYYDYRADKYGWREGVGPAAGRFTDGTLNIDVIDTASNRLLWEGIAVGSVSQRMYESLEATIDSVTATLFEHFPQRPQS